MNFFKPCLVIYQMKGNGTNISMKELKLIYRAKMTPKWPQNDLKFDFFKPCLVIYQMKGNLTNMSMKEVKLIFRAIWTLKWPKINLKWPQNDLKLNLLKPCLMVIYLMKGNGTNMSMKEVKLIFRVIWTLKWPKWPLNDLKMTSKWPIIEYFKTMSCFISNER